MIFYPIEATAHPRFSYCVHLAAFDIAALDRAHRWCLDLYGPEASQAKMKARRLPYDWQRWGRWRNYGPCFYFHQFGDALQFQFTWTIPVCDPV